MRSLKDFAEGFVQVPEVLPLRYRVAGGILLLNAVLLGLERILLPGQLWSAHAPWEGFVAFIDLLLGGLLVVGSPPVVPWARGRALLGAVGFSAIHLFSGDPVGAGIHVVLGATTSALLLSREARWPLAAGGLGLALVVAWAGLDLVSLLTGDSLLTRFALHSAGRLDRHPVDRVIGTAAAYRITLPSNHWYPGRPAPQGADLYLVHPRRDAELSVFVERAPGSRGADLRQLEKRVTDKPGVTVVQAQELAGPYDSARLLQVRQSFGGRPVESLVALVAVGSHAFQVVASAPVRGFPALKEELLEAVRSFGFVPPRRPTLAPDAVAKVKQASVLVLTARGSGSGFIVGKRGEAWLAVTRAGAVLGEGGETPDRVEVVLAGTPKAEARRALLIVEDRASDLALLEVPMGAERLEPLHPRKTKGLAEGAPVFSAGFPHGLKEGVWGSRPTVRFNGGYLVAGTVKPPSEGLLQLDVGIDAGNGGGPVVDGEGALLGVALAHVKQSEASFVIPAEKLVDFLARRDVTLAWDTKASPPVSSPQPRPTEEGLARAAAATVLVLADGRWGPGLVLPSPKQKLLVLTRYSVVFETGGAYRSRPGRVQVTLRPGTKEARSFPAELLRAVEGRGLALLSLPRPVEAPEPPPLGTAKGFVETAPVELLGLREPWRGGAFDVDSAFAQLRHGMVASLEHDHGQKLTALNVDLGVGTGFQAGAAINASGEVVGLAGATPTAEEGSHVLPVIPAERIEQFLGGDVRGVAARYVADGLGHCYVELNAELDDPLHAVEQVGVAVAELAGLDALGLGAAEPPAQTVQRPVEGGSSRVLLDIRPERCPPVLGFQLFLERNRGGRARDVWRALPLQPSPVEVKSQTYESSFLVGDQAPLNFKEFLATRMVPPKGWTPVCEPSEPDSCARACAGGEFRGCYVQALQLYPRATSGFAYAQFPPLKRACDADVGPACHVMGLGYEKASPRERPQASRYFDIACAHGVGAACRKIALERQAAGNHDGAIRALRRGCEYLDGESCDRLGETYLRGEGVEKDVQTAAEHFLRACQTFQATGCVNLAKVYGEGTLGAPDPAVAFRLYSNACELGLADACLTVGRLSTEGRGTDRALNHAEAAYRKACGLGNREACETMRMLRR